MIFPAFQVNPVRLKALTVQGLQQSKLNLSDLRASESALATSPSISGTLKWYHIPLHNLDFQAAV